MRLAGTASQLHKDQILQQLHGLVLAARLHQVRDNIPQCAHVDGPHTLEVTLPHRPQSMLTLRKASLLACVLARLFLPTRPTATELSYPVTLQIKLPKVVRGEDPVVLRSRLCTAQISLRHQLDKLGV